MLLALFEHCVDVSKVLDLPGRPEVTVRCGEGSLVCTEKKHTNKQSTLPRELFRTNPKEIVRIRLKSHSTW